VESAYLPLGHALYQLRLAHGFDSIDGVAHAAGLHASTVAGIENGRGDPQLSSIARLAVVFGRFLCIRPIRPHGLNRGKSAAR
jgi:transcriptional regulator with XRE-family HTH domain